MLMVNDKNLDVFMKERKISSAWAPEDCLSFQRPMPGLVKTVRSPHPRSSWRAFWSKLSAVFVFVNRGCGKRYFCCKIITVFHLWNTPGVDGRVIWHFFWEDSSFYKFGYTTVVIKGIIVLRKSGFSTAPDKRKGDVRWMVSLRDAA